jgi:hypothetical protein
MSRYIVENPSVSVVIDMRRLTSVLLAIVMSGAMASPPASASSPGMVAASAGDHGPVRNGNGIKNKNYSAVRSPTIMRGQQNVSISISGKTNTQSALCKRGRHACNISQRIRTSHGR